MKKIYKYEVFTGFSSVHMPINARILDIQTQNDRIFIWAIFDKDENSFEYRHFEAVETGWSIPETERGKAREYIGTVQVIDHVWHIFEIVTQIKRIP